jgi:hypothetical protein
MSYGKLSKGEILTIIVLYLFGGKAMTSELAKVSNIPETYIRNIVLKLRRKNIITSLSSTDIRGLSSEILKSTPKESGDGPTAPLLGFAPLDIEPPKTKENIHILKVEFKELLDKYPEILEYAKTLFPVKTKEEFIKYLDDLKPKLRSKID